MKSNDQQLLEEAYNLILEASDPHMGKLFKVGDTVMLKHASLTTPTRIYKDHKPGDLFEVIGRTLGTSPMRRFQVKSKNTGEIYSIHSYNIQQADKPLANPILRVPKKLTGDIICSNCKKQFSLNLPGKSHRDHCPHCLCSVHIDSKPGDRSVWCGKGEPGTKEFIYSVLIPIARSAENSPSYILYQCEKCGKQKVNIQASDDNFNELQKLPVREFKAKGYKI
jgi:DNA-directed RNA polymerase subunit RPC12/RpoP